MLYLHKMSVWNKKPISGVLLDITGVLMESGGGGTAISGSAEAVKRCLISWSLVLSLKVKSIHSHFSFFLSIDTESIKFRSSSQVWWVAKF